MHGAEWNRQERMKLERQSLNGNERIEGTGPDLMGKAVDAWNSVELTRGESNGKAVGAWFAKDWT